MAINYDLYKEVREVLKNEPVERHSYFQLKYFLIGKEPTLQAKMWQCLRELKTRIESLESLGLEIEETKDRKSLLDISVERLNLELSNISKDDELVQLRKREIAINLRQLGRQILGLDASLKQLHGRQKFIEEECMFFYETFKNLVQIEPLKHFDDFDSQKQYWGEKLAQKLNYKLLSSNQLDTELVETILALPDDMPIKQQTIGTLNLRHASMVKHLEDASKLDAKNYGV